MAPNPDVPPGDPAHHRHFLDLIQQLEHMIEAELVAWSAPSAAAAQRRLDRLTHALQQVVKRLEGK